MVTTNVSLHWMRVICPRLKEGPESIQEQQKKKKNMN